MAGFAHMIPQLLEQPALLQKPLHRFPRDLWWYGVRPIELPKGHLISRLFQEWNHLTASILERQDLIRSAMGDQDARLARPLRSRRHKARRERDRRTKQIARLICRVQSYTTLRPKSRRSRSSSSPRAAAKILCRARGRSAARQVHSRNGLRPMWTPHPRVHWR